jgi:hypothetical protein
MPSHKPQLPAQFVQKLLAMPTFSDINSFVFTQPFHEHRFKMVTGSNPTKADLSADITVCLEEGNSIGMGPNEGRTYLHLGSVVGDPLLVCEMIRLGATIDLQDARGATALWLATSYLEKSIDATKRRRHAQVMGYSQTPAPDPTRRIVYSIHTLIGQRANVNIVHDGLTPLHFACRAKNWDIITLLLEHGAIASLQSASPNTLFTNPKDRKHFETLVKASSGKPRPPRPCPCWSGKLLSECHDAEEKPYPPEFICRCGSGKTHAKCCIRRTGMKQIEKWDEEGDWIMPVTVKILSAERGDLLQHAMGVMSEAAAKGRLPDKQTLHNYQGRMADILAKQGHIDIAYAYALKQVDFNPRFVNVLPWFD